ncbi:isoleucine--tRNA ligase [bacterium]|nr:isoleucine--tRNA ligase [bacterium]
MNYRDTLNLPQTTFPMKANLKDMEPRIQGFWDELEVYDLMCEKNTGKPKYILHDGPPYANGHIHMGHALNKILKDIIVKYKAMSGFDAPFVPGWDCHGMPIEHQVMKEIRNKAEADLCVCPDKQKAGFLQIRDSQFEIRDSKRVCPDKQEAEGKEHVGADLCVCPVTTNVRKMCADYAAKFVDIQRKEFKRLGIFGDWENPYLTMSKEYSAGIIEVFEQLVRNGFVYKSNKPVFWCRSCATALAEAEVEYIDKQSPSVYVKFPMLQEDNTFVLIWTTTPWTLPGNVAIAVHADFEYVRVRIKSNAEFRIQNSGVRSHVGADLCVCPDKQEAGFLQIRDSQFEIRDSKRVCPDKQEAEVGADLCVCPDKHEAEGSNQDYEILILARDLLDVTMEKTNIKEYEVLDSFIGRTMEGKVCRHPFIERDSIIILADYVTRDQGTGCVHTAPGHGIDDYGSGMRYKLPVITPVNEKGCFTEEAGEFAGMDVFKANPVIIEKLKGLDRLLHTETINHSYPHCWRCKQPIIFRATPQWFINIDKDGFRERVLSDIDKVAWLPSWGRDRFYNTVSARPDWCISRQRTWGVPIPAFYCEDCGEYILDGDIISFVKEQIRQFGADIWFDSETNKLIPEGTACPKCNSHNLRKEKDILDVWFESGSSYCGVLKERDYLDYPADLYLEGSDQHRGWFQSSMLTACATEGHPPYKSVLTHGFMVDANGKAMHKSSGNVIAPEEIITQYGADILRLWVSSEDYRQDVKIGKEILQRMSESYRKIRNTWRFMLSNLYDFSEADSVPYDSLQGIDQWALHRLQVLLQKVDQAYTDFEFHQIYHLLMNFCTVDMSAIYLDVIKDRLYTHGKNSLSRRSAQTVLREILGALIPLATPVLSFTCEEIWQHLSWEREKSVFLAGFPMVNNAFVNEELAVAWERIFEIRQQVNNEIEKYRADGVVGSSLEAQVTLTLSKEDKKALEKYAGKDTADVFIVSNLITKEGDFGIEVQKTTGKKCIRCWRYSENTGISPVHTELCPRCTEVCQDQEMTMTEMV